MSGLRICFVRDPDDVQHGLSLSDVVLTRSATEFSRAASLLAIRANTPGRSSTSRWKEYGERARFERDLADRVPLEHDRVERAFDRRGGGGRRAAGYDWPSFPARRCSSR